MIRPEIQGKFPAVIDSTIRADFASCPTSWYYSHCRHLGFEKSVDLLAGGSFAKGLEITRSEYWGKGTPFPEALQRGMMAAIAEWGNYTCPETKLQKNIDRVVLALEAYFTRWPIASDPIKPYFWAERKPAVEFTFAIPLPRNHPDTGEPIIYAGRMDMIGVFNDQIFLIDEKTASQLGPTWGTRWNLRAQFSGYTWAARESGLPVAGAIVRGISFLKNSFGFAESMQFRSEWQVDNWYEQLLHDIDRMIEAYTKKEYSQNLGNSCESFNGCIFSDLCASSNPEAWIDAGKYTHREWNPLSVYPTGKPTEKEAEVVPLGFTLV